MGEREPVAYGWKITAIIFIVLNIIFVAAILTGIFLLKKALKSSNGSGPPAKPISCDSCCDPCNPDSSGSGSMCSENLCAKYGPEGEYANSMVFKANSNSPIKINVDPITFNFKPGNLVDVHINIKVSPNLISVDPVVANDVKYTYNTSTCELIPDPTNPMLLKLQNEYGGRIVNLMYNPEADLLKCHLIINHAFPFDIKVDIDVTFAVNSKTKRAPRVPAQIPCTSGSSSPPPPSSPPPSSPVSPSPSCMSCEGAGCPRSHLHLFEKVSEECKSKGCDAMCNIFSGHNGKCCKK